ncbi:NlpC/P60 family protein [Hymenobacter busanensis]|uniref:NlpC/P60 family protein n=1 Tax=Hymenobacter busanensis TaxID=2607656 RepID=A0A7L4ZYH6_9BACT|nr:C40 family peptidase [Hymenobacter busanensis]KAA9339746.1 NlpC/P60 family protein [Hymenobacter busanensis]QHJ06500.1 NlpC/P60 family protein [Hymenobacter busanensis]
MRYVWLMFGLFTTALLGLLAWQQLRPAAPVPASGDLPPVRAVVYRATAGPSVTRADSVVRLALRQLGKAYCYAGTTPEGGFDCSGFLTYVYSQFDVDVPHSSALQYKTGTAVPREQARKGDLIIFTGTAQTSTTPGHAGIVISEPGQPLRFVHSSSSKRDPGVKISQVDGTDYERRFLGIRRVL